MDYEIPSKGPWQNKKITKMFISEGHGKVELNIVADDCCYVLFPKKLKIRMATLDKK